MRVIAYETITRKGKRMLVYAGSVEHENAKMFGQTLVPLVYQGKSIPREDCADTILRHGLEPGKGVRAL